MSTWSAYKNLRANLNQSIAIDAEHLSSSGNISLIPGKKGTIPTIQFNQNSGNAALAIFFPKPVRTGVLEVEIDPSAELYRNDLSLRVILDPSGNGSMAQSFNIKSNKWLPLRPDNHIYRIPLYRGYVKTFVVLEFKYAGNLPGIPIKSISIRPASFYDFPAGGLLVCLAVVVAMFLPGLVFALSNPRLNILPLPITSFLYSLLINFFGLLIVKLFNKDILFIPTITLTVAVLFIIFRSRQQTWKASFQSIYRESIPDLNVWFVILLMTCTALSFLYPSAVFNIHQGHLSRDHTFYAFTAHDSVFQFANSKSILEDNFEKYYGDELNRKLLFLPQDREILPGLGYASIILFVKTFLGDELAQKYFPYTIYYLISHTLLLCMLFAWFKSYDLKLAYAGTFFIGTTPVFWTLAMIGWFKLTGAALILAGIFVIKDRPLVVSRWIWAGILFGLAKNYHGGNALALPVLTLWLLFVTYKSTGVASLRKLGVFFVSLTVSACLIIFPWNLYLTHVWHVSSHRLLSIHFLNNNFVSDSLWLSIVQFFNNVSLTEQLHVRIERTLDMFSSNQLIRLFATYEVNNSDSILSWLNFSSSYLLPSVVLYLFLSLSVALVIKKSIPEEKRQPFQSDLWLNQFGWICLVNLIVLAFASYGSVEGNAGITWHYPPLLIIGILSSIVCWSCKKHRNYSVIWVYAGFFQLGLLLAYG